MYAPSYVLAKILMHLEKCFSEDAISEWFEDAEAIAVSDDTLILYSPSDFRQQIIRDTCSPYILEVLREMLQCNATLEVWGNNELRAYKEEQKRLSISFKPQFTFDNFISGSSNLQAVTIAKEVAKNACQDLHNPLFLYGPPGVGKTHLLLAIANTIKQSFPDKKVVYTLTDQFTSELIFSLQNGRTDDFKQKYRTADVLLIDDIQFIAGRETTQEELFHIFNDLYEHKKQIIMAANRHPGDIATLESRLKDGFDKGIMVGIDSPGYETRCEITKLKAKKCNLELSDELVRYVANSLTDNIRQIEGALKRIRAVHELDGLDLTLENIQETLGIAYQKEQRNGHTESIN